MFPLVIRGIFSANFTLNSYPIITILYFSVHNLNSYMDIDILADNIIEEQNKTEAVPL